VSVVSGEKRFGLFAAAWADCTWRSGQPFVIFGLLTMKIAQVDRRFLILSPGSASLHPGLRAIVPFRAKNGTRRKCHLNFFVPHLLSLHLRYHLRRVSVPPQAAAAAKYNCITLQS
jgi:hypothetical protein